jgi:THO complex subunit 4
MSLDECIKLSGGSSSLKKKVNHSRQKSSKPREKTARKAGAGATEKAPGAAAPGKERTASAAAAPQNGVAKAAPSPDAGRAAGGISKKRRRSKKTSAAALAADDANGAPTNTRSASGNQDGRANNAGAPGKPKASRESNGKAAPESRPMLAPPAQATSRIAVSNLNDTVTEEDIKELFADVGPLVSAKLLLDRDGRSAGRAEVVFQRMPDALEAIKRYNTIPLDEMPLRITLATDRSSAPDMPSSYAPGNNGSRQGRDQHEQNTGNRHGSRAAGRGGGRPRGGRPPQRGRSER